MTKEQFSAAVAMVEEGRVPANVDTEVLFGCALPGFKPVITTLEVVAAFIQYQAMMFNGQWDSEALNDMRNLLRHKVEIVGSGS